MERRRMRVVGRNTRSTKRLRSGQKVPRPERAFKGNNKDIRAHAHTHTDQTWKMFESRDIERDYERWLLVSCERWHLAIVNGSMLAHDQEQ